MTLPEKKYNMSHDKLAMMVGDFVSNLNRDITKVTARGITQQQIDDFEAKGNAFELLQPDEYYRALISVKVQEKDTARADCFDNIQYISGFFEQKWGIGSPMYRTLAISGILSFGEDKFINRGRNVVTVATDNLATLTPLGLTQLDIDTLQTNLQTMEDKLHEVRSQQKIREEKTLERINKGNSLYVQLKQFSVIGKLVWENVDEAKYNDYVIYKTVHSGLSKVQNLAVTTEPAAPELAKLTWDGVTGALEYEIYLSQVAIGAPADEFSLAQTVLDTFADMPLAPSFRYYFKVRAKNPEQLGSFSDEVWIEL